MGHAVLGGAVGMFLGLWGGLLIIAWEGWQLHRRGAVRPADRAGAAARRDRAGLVAGALWRHQQGGAELWACAECAAAAEAVRTDPYAEAQRGRPYCLISTVFVGSQPHGEDTNATAQAAH